MSDEDRRTDEQWHPSEKVADLDSGMSIWKVHVDLCREQYKNARMMEPEKFQQLVENVKKDGHLESLPLCVKRPNPERNEFEIISGHHRVGAARAAGVMLIYILVVEADWSEDRIRSKQLAHNALAGIDDATVLRELYESIKDLELRIASGVRAAELEAKVSGFKIDEMSIELDYRVVNLVFLARQKREFMGAIERILGDDTVVVADLEVYDLFREALAKVKKVEHVRQLTSVLEKMAEIVKDHYAEVQPEDQVAEVSHRPTGTVS